MRDEEGTDCTLRLGAAAQPACDALTEERLTLYWGEEALDALCVQSGLALSAEACERVNEQPPAPGAPGDRFRDASSMRVDTSPDGAAPPEPTADPSPMLVLCTTGSWPDASALFAECPQRLRALDHCEAGQLDDRDCETLRRLETEQPCVTDAGTDDATPRRQ